MSLPTVGDVAGAIRSGHVHAEVVLGEHLDRVRASGLNAVVTLDPSAPAAARAADRAVAVGAPPGPLNGVPFTVKDTIDTAGLRTTAGSRALADRVADRSATAVDRLRAAGAILLGKTNCSEFAVDIHTANPLFGATLNPLDPRVTAGGSSGGEAAAVAAGLSVFGLGTDFGGSLRWSAHCTGVCTLRPTPGLLPGDGVLPHLGGPPDAGLLLHRLMTVGPLTRDAGDLALLLRVLAGCSAWVDAGSIRLPPIAWCGGEGSVPVAGEVVDVVRAAAGRLRPLAGEVVEARPAGLDECAELFTALRDGDGLPEVEHLVAGREHLLSADLARYLHSARPLHPARRRRLNARIAAIGAEASRFLARRPILLLPVASVPAPAHDAEVDVDGLRVPFGRIASSCRAISVLGLPSAVVPSASGVDGRPIGVQIVGRPFHEHEVLAVAEALSGPHASP